MSLRSLHAIAQYQHDQDRAVDDTERARTTVRKSVTPPNQLLDQIEVLYQRIATCMRRNETKIGLELHPHDVIEGVISKLASKGWNAKHSYNDGYNQFDHLLVTPKTDNL